MKIFILTIWLLLSPVAHSVLIFLGTISGISFTSVHPYIIAFVELLIWAFIAMKIFNTGARK